jgi:hypothetical protein
MHGKPTRRTTPWTILGMESQSIRSESWEPRLPCTRAGMPPNRTWRPCPSLLAWTKSRRDQPQNRLSGLNGLAPHPCRPANLGGLLLNKRQFLSGENRPLLKVMRCRLDGEWPTPRKNLLPCPPYAKYAVSHRGQRLHLEQGRPRPPV